MSLMAERTVSDERQDITSREPIPKAGNDCANIELIAGLDDACEASPRQSSITAGNEVPSCTYVCHKPSKEAYI